MWFLNSRETRDIEKSGTITGIYEDTSFWVFSAIPSGAETEPTSDLANRQCLGERRCQKVINTAQHIPLLIRGDKENSTNSKLQKILSCAEINQPIQFKERTTRVSKLQNYGTRFVLEAFGEQLTHLTSFQRFCAAPAVSKLLLQLSSSRSTHSSGNCSLVGKFIFRRHR